MSQKNTVQLNIRIDKELKENAERVLADFGITPSSAISMLYSQIVMRNEFPLELKRNKSMTESISDKDEKVSALIVKVVVSKKLLKFCYYHDPLACPVLP